MLDAVFLSLRELRGIVAKSKSGLVYFLFPYRLALLPTTNVTPMRVKKDYDTQTSKELRK